MHILLVEDDDELAARLERGLAQAGFVVERASDGHDGLELAQQPQMDVIVLDLGLPGKSGLEVLREIRSLGVTPPVLVLTARGTWADKVSGLNDGADDYLTKPFHLSELLVRIQALIRRKYFKGNNLVSYNEIEIDLLSKTVKVKKKEIEMTKKEIDLLLYLIGNENKVLSKSSIAEHLSGDMADMLDNHDFVYAHIKNLKKKLNDAGYMNYIKTVYGLGYKWKNG